MGCTVFVGAGRGRVTFGKEGCTAGQERVAAAGSNSKVERAGRLPIAFALGLWRKDLTESEAVLKPSRLGCLYANTDKHEAGGAEALEGISARFKLEGSNDKSGVPGVSIFSIFTLESSGIFGFESLSS